MTSFGTLSDGRAVERLTIAGHGLSACVLTYGAILQDLRLEGVAHSLTVGSEDFARYEGDLMYHGAVVGPVANRLGGGKAVIDGIEHRFETNQDNLHTLHGGSAGTHAKLWDVADHGFGRLTLTLTMQDGEGGFPGTRQLTALFEVLPGPALQLTLTTTSTEPSIANATNHSYWTLDGSGHLRDHTLRVMADHVLPTDATSLPTGEVAEVTGTAFDLRQPTRFTPGAPPLDNTYGVARTRGALTDRMVLSAGALSMTVATTEPGVHLYDGRPHYDGIAIECQGWPDAPNNAHFPPIDVTPEAPVQQVTRWSFAAL